MKKPSFTLSRKNQKGQVAIFVALIFQVIFVFFALLINVGLLVHHKINLQQSTDLAAYYGAMKQAESLNAMAHVNYQIRQAWKLLTWRYRVFGTFGMQGTDAGIKPIFPVTLGNPSVVSNLAIFDSGNPCLNKANTADTPFFCVGHGGIKGWIGGTTENLCKVNCNLVNNLIYTVPGVSNPGAVQGVAGNAQAVAVALDTVNTNLEAICNKLANSNIKILAQFILAYQQEMTVRSQTMNMLAGNLTNESSELLDLDGKKVLDGVTKTLRNNLTEANNDQTALKIKSYNSLSHEKCSLDKSNPASNHNLSKAEFIKRIEFEFINFFQHGCIPVPGVSNSTNQNFNPGSIFNLSMSGLANGEVNPANSIKTMKIGPPEISPSIESEIMRLISNNEEKFTIGYEKNPWCPAYFVVQASTKPRIPFLPLVEIKIHAASVAKPFGGSLGPWYAKTWPQDKTNSQINVQWNNNTEQTDETLPTVKRINPPPTTLKDNGRMLMNFSRYVGDAKGVSDPKYLSEYHAALVTRLQQASTVTGYGAQWTSETGGTNLSEPAYAPTMSSWNKTYDFENPEYDPIVGGVDNKDSFLRELEISAISPNQFDLTYYSIDADYYNNYYKRLSDPTIFGKLKAAAGGLGPQVAKYVRPDFGNNKKIYTQKEEFSIRNQIEIIKKAFVDPAYSAGLANASPKFHETFPELVKRQSSLLTGWTYKNFTDFDTFPGNDMTTPSDTMNFARCSDPWQMNGTEYKIPKEVSNTLPSTPGNCVTGGRVGYSVKLVSPSTLSGTVAQPLGGPNVMGVILNPIPMDYYDKFE